MAPVLGGLSGVCHGLLCWYVEAWSGGDVDYGPHADRGAHGGQIAFVPPVFFNVKAGEELRIECAWDDVGGLRAGVWAGTGGAGHAAQ